MLNSSTLKRTLQGASKRFHTDLSDPARAQREVLQSILQQNKTCVFGKQHGFSVINDATSFAARVPISDYEALSPLIERMSQGETNLLTTHKVLAFEETGGSNEGSKIIPYTAAGLEAFQNGLLPWLNDLYGHHSDLCDGRFYWAISPACRVPKVTQAGIPVGMSDVAYFGDEVGSDIAARLAVPLEANNIANIEQWRDFTLQHLFKCESLSLISVWSPSFLTELLRHAVLKRETLAQAIAHGNTSDDMSLSAIEIRERRAELVLAELSQPVPDYHRIWTRLRVISCWDHASAAMGAATLRRMFPKVQVQGKGLLATEGLVTIPLTGYDYPVLALRSAFYEFMDSYDNVFRADQLECEKEYQLLITTHSGLYRYDIGDKVLVRGFAMQTPMLEFTGRSNATSDMCGEKLNDAFVMKGLAALGQSFAMLAPNLANNADRNHYVLLLDQGVIGTLEAISMAAIMEQTLHDNPQYEYARRIGQLDEVVPVLCDRPLECWLRERMDKGQRLGDIKIPALLMSTQWKTWAKNVRGDLP